MTSKTQSEENAAGKHSSMEPAPTPGPSSPTSEEAIGGEVRIGRGPAPAFLRWFNYAVYLAGAVYLVLLWPDTGYHPVVIIFAALLVAWVVYIYLGKKPAEP